MTAVAIIVVELGEMAVVGCKIVGMISFSDLSMVTCIQAGAWDLVVVVKDAVSVVGILVIVIVVVGVGVEMT